MNIGVTNRTLDFVLLFGGHILQRSIIWFREWSISSFKKCFYSMIMWKSGWL